MYTHIHVYERVYASVTYERLHTSVYVRASHTSVHTRAYVCMCIVRVYTLTDSSALRKPTLFVAGMPTGFLQSSAPKAAPRAQLPTAAIQPPPSGATSKPCQPDRRPGRQPAPSSAAPAHLLLKRPTAYVYAHTCVRACICERHIRASTHERVCASVTYERTHTSVCVYVHRACVHTD